MHQSRQIRMEWYCRTHSPSCTSFFFRSNFHLLLYTRRYTFGRFSVALCHTSVNVSVLSLFFFLLFLHSFIWHIYYDAHGAPPKQIWLSFAKGHFIQAHFCEIEKKKSGKMFASQINPFVLVGQSVHAASTLMN